MILLSKVDKMKYFFTFTVTRTVITVDPNQPVVNTDCITTNTVREDENDQRSMRYYFDGLVNHIIPTGMKLVNYSEPQLFNALHGIRPLPGNYNLDRTLDWFIHNVTPTHRHLGPISRTHFAFMINVVVRRRDNLTAKRKADGTCK